MSIKSNIITARPSELADLAAIAFASNQLFFLVGDGGAAKTSIACKTLPQALGIPLWGGKPINLAGMAGTEVTGYGNPQPDGVTMKFYAPDIWPTIERVGDEHWLVCLDELPDYSTEVRALLRGLTPSSGAACVGPHQLGPNVRFVVTGNLRSSGTRAVVEDAPFTSRTCKVLLEPNVADWLEWYDSQPNLLASGSHVPAFLKFGAANDDWFCPAVAMPYDGAPHPTPRGWEAVAKAEPFRQKNPSLFDKYVAGVVGLRASSAFSGFLAHVNRLPDIASLKANPESFTVPTDPAAQYGLVSACLAVALRGVDKPEIAVHAGEFDWLASLLLRVRGDIREFGAQAAVKRGIPLDCHKNSAELLIG